MTTPLQKAAQELIDRIADLGASPLDWAEYTALEAALEAEQEQAVEPLLWVRKDQLNQMASGFLLSAYRSTEGRTDLTPVFAHPAPPADDFDTWQKNPYTLVLQKSIAEDYVPKKAQQVAAPELLEALREVLQWIDDNCETTGFDAVERKADAAIAKATGETL